LLQRPLLEFFALLKVHWLLFGLDAPTLHHHSSV